MRLGRQPDGVVPDRGGLVVVGVHGDPEPVPVETEVPGEQLPRPRDGLGLEVVPEAEVAQHLEEGEVAGGAAHQVDVVVLAADPHALLHGRRPAVGRDLLPEEVRDELVHPGVGEQRGPRVLGDQAGRGEAGVPAGPRRSP